MSNLVFITTQSAATGMIQHDLPELAVLSDFSSRGSLPARSCTEGKPRGGGILSRAAAASVPQFLHWVVPLGPRPRLRRT